MRAQQEHVYRCPQRKITKVVGSEGKRYVVELECGHTLTYVRTRSTQVPSPGRVRFCVACGPESP